MTKTHVRGVMRDLAYNAIDGERDYQLQKFGPHRKNSVGDYLVMLDQYLDQAKFDHVEGDEDAARHGLRKIAAIAVAAMEHHGVRSREQEEATKAAEIELPAFTDQFNEFLKGARVAAGEPFPGDEPITQGVQAGAEIEFPPNMPEELKALLGDVLSKANPGGKVKVLEIGIGFPFRR